MLRPEPLDIVIILFVGFLLFGGINRLPETTRALGKAIREFRLAIAGKDEDEQSSEKGNKA